MLCVMATIVGRIRIVQRCLQVNSSQLTAPSISRNNIPYIRQLDGRARGDPSGVGGV